MADTIREQLVAMGEAGGDIKVSEGTAWVQLVLRDNRFVLNGAFTFDELEAIVAYCEELMGETEG